MLLTHLHVNAGSELDLWHIPTIMKLAHKTTDIMAEETKTLEDIMSDKKTRVTETENWTSVNLKCCKGNLTS